MISLRKMGATARAGVIATATAGMLAAGAGVFALTSSASPSAPAAATATKVLKACVTYTSNTWVYDWNGAACPSGTYQVSWNQTGPQGPAGAAGATGATGTTGPAGPQGPAGTNGSDATLSVTAQTAITGWPESSGWANDSMTRTVDITRQHAAPSAKCGGTPTCWFYTATLNDNGTFTTVAGQKVPNGTGANINGIVSGTMIGEANVEFYASTDTPNGSLVPPTATGAAKPSSTTNWVELAFPSGTKFSAPSLTAYSWVYSATSPNTCEKWTDQINPGDDGQSAADGNISGINHCTT